MSVGSWIISFQMGLIAFYVLMTRYGERLKAWLDREEAQLDRARKEAVGAPDEVWSMDFVFDELANGRRVKTLTVVDDCSKEAVQIAVDTSIPALYVTRVTDQVKAERGLPKVIRTENGPEFAGRTMQT